MLCTVILLDGTTENITLAKHAIGRWLLEEVCRRLKLTAEMDYFGLKFCNKTGQETWLNLRNEIRMQMGKSNMYRFNLRVKYFVNQSQIIQENTRHQFYLNVKQNHLQGKYILSRDRRPRFHALLLRSEHGEDALTAVTNHPLIMEDWNAPREFEALEGLRAEHARLKGVSSEEAENMLLSEMETVERTYGSELFHATNSFQEHVIIAVCRDAVRVFGNCDKALIDEYHYASGLYPSHKGKNFFIEIQEDYRCYKIAYKLDNRMTARNLHRATVEFCTFYTHECASDWVSDSKHKTNAFKTLTSLLKHRKDRKYKTPKLYKYDVIRTVVESFEYAWRLVADEKARSMQIRCGIQTPRTPRPDTQFFKFGPDTPSTPRLEKLVLDEPRTPMLYKQAFKVGSGPTPRTPRLVVEKLVFKFGPDTPRTPRPDQPVFKFEPVTQRTSPRLDRHVFKLEPTTPRTIPRLDKQVFKFEPDLPRKMDEPDFSPRSGFLTVPDRTPTPKRVATPSEASSTPTKTPSSSPRKQPDGGEVVCPENDKETPIADIANNLRMTPLAKQQQKIFKERFLCKLCKKDYKTCAFVPCGHVVTCWSCAVTCERCCDCQEHVDSVKPVKYP